MRLCQFVVCRSNILAWASFCVLVIAISTGCHTESKSLDSTKKKLSVPVPADAATLTVSKCHWPTVVRTQGSLTADERTTISSKVAGRIEETLVDLGDIVRANQTLAKIEISDFELGVRQAQAQLAEACAAIGLQPNNSIEDIAAESVPSVAVEKALWDETIQALQRAKKLRQTNSISDSEFIKQEALEQVAQAKYEAALRTVDQQKALIESRRVQLALAQQNMEDATIRASFDGVIQRRHLAAGTYVQPGTPIFTLVRIDPLRFQGRIPERKAAQVRVEQPISISIEGHDQPVQANVKRVSPALDIASRSLQIEAELPNPDGVFRSGVFAEGTIVVDAEATTTAIPISAIGEFAGVYKVWMVKDGQLTSKKITPGRKSIVDGIQMQEVTQGVELGDVLLSDYTIGDTARRNAGKANSTFKQPAAQGH